MTDNTFPGIYRAKVLDNNDSTKAGLIKAEVYPMLLGEETARLLRASGVHEALAGVATADLPWAAPAMPLFGGAGSGHGTFCVPAVGSLVWVFFEAGDIEQPVYFAEAPDAVHGLPSSRTTNYPNRRLIRTPGGVELIVDDTAKSVSVSGATTVNISGSSDITIQSSGSVTISGSDAVTIEGSTVEINP